MKTFIQQLQEKLSNQPLSDTVFTATLIVLVAAIVGGIIWWAFRQPKAVKNTTNEFARLFDVLKDDEILPGVTEVETPEGTVYRTADIVRVIHMRKTQYTYGGYTLISVDPETREVYINHYDIEDVQVFADVPEGQGGEAMWADEKEVDGEEVLTIHVHSANEIEFI